MASSCCGTKKQKMNNQSCNHAKTNGHGPSSLSHNHHAANHNGICPNGYDGVEQVANPEMCFFCFEVLYCELYRLNEPSEPSCTDDA